MRSLSLLISLLITGLIFWGLASLHIDRIDPMDLLKKPVKVYQLYRLKKVAPKSKDKKLKPKRKKKQAIKKKLLKTQVPKTQSTNNPQAPTKNAKTEKVYEMKDLSEDIVMLKRVIPKYPELAKRAGIECKLLLEVIVNEKGNVVTADVLSSTTEKYGFNENAIKAVNKLRFKPMQVKGKASKVRLIYPIDFVLIE